MRFCGQGGGFNGSRRPCLKGFKMSFGKNWFKILSFVITIMRLFAAAFGDDEDEREVAASKKRSASSNADEVC